VDDDGFAQLADPGLLSILQSSPLVKSGSGSANIRWTAPELLKKNRPPPTNASDVYAFAMTCLEVYSLDVPFADEPEYLVPGKVLQDDRPDRPAGISDYLWSLLKDGWNADVNERPDMSTVVRGLDSMK